MAGWHCLYIPPLRHVSRKPDQKLALGFAAWGVHLTYRAVTLRRANQGRLVMKRLVRLADRDSVEKERLVVRNMEVA